MKERKEEKLERLFEDENFFTKFHEEWFFAPHGAYILVWEDGKISILPQNTDLHEEDWARVLLAYPCPGNTNIDTSVYEEGVGVYDEVEEKWRWDPEFLESHPEYKKIACPEWEDIIRASIKEGEWSEFKKEILNSVRG